MGSSEDSSSSPSTLPRTQKSSLRQSSSLQIEDTSSPKKKGILKASVSIDNTKTTGQEHASQRGPPPPPPAREPPRPSSPSTTILENLQQLITAEPPSQLQRTSSTKIRIHPELVDRSDSGRESDEIEPPPEKSKTVSVVTVSTDSANSSFDANDPTLAWKINIVKDANVADHHPVAENYSSPLKKKVKPPPPPRSSQTKLSTVQQQLKPKSILSPTSSLNPEMSPTEALDHLIHNIDSHNNKNNNNNRLRSSEKKKRVKFNPRVDTSKAPPEPPLEEDREDFEDPPNLQTTITQPLDPNFLHFLPRLNQKQDVNKNAADNNQVHDDSKKKNFSYYEPYI